MDHSLSLPQAAVLLDDQLFRFSEIAVRPLEVLSSKTITMISLQRNGAITPGKHSVDKAAIRG